MTFNELGHQRSLSTRYQESDFTIELWPVVGTLGEPAPRSETDRTDRTALSHLMCRQSGVVIVRSYQNESLSHAPDRS
jgi:hypothetical protein